MLPSQPNQALIDGLAVLQALAVSAEPIGSREMARILHIEPTRANRLLRTLTHLGMASQTVDRKYVPGPAMHVLSAQSLFGSGLIRRALGPLKELAHLGLIVALGVLWRDQVCYLYHASAGMPAEAALGRVGLYPASRSSIGQALLAEAAERDIRELYRDREVEGFASIDAFLTQLERVRRQGWAYVGVDAGGTVSTLGVAIGTPGYAAIALSGKIELSDIPALIAELGAAAARIETT